jgi:hypothetical protein
MTIEDLLEGAGRRQGPESAFTEAQVGVRRGVMAQYLATLSRRPHLPAVQH